MRGRHLVLMMAAFLVPDPCAWAQGPPTSGTAAIGGASTNIRNRGGQSVIAIRAVGATCNGACETYVQITRELLPPIEFRAAALLPARRRVQEILAFERLCLATEVLQNGICRVAPDEPDDVFDAHHYPIRPKDGWARFVPSAKTMNSIRNRTLYVLGWSHDRSLWVSSDTFWMDRARSR